MRPPKRRSSSSGFDRRTRDVAVTLICDTGVVFAALNRNDRHHSRCAELLAASAATTLPAPVLVEIDWMARSRGVPEATDALLAAVDRREALVVDLDWEDYRRVRALQQRYLDLPLDFVDAAVIAVAERLEQTRVATLDRRHFSVVRPLHVEAFELVP
jgi:predicted nucleic acid-binding protein